MNGMHRSFSGMSAMRTATNEHQFIPEISTSSDMRRMIGKQAAASAPYLSRCGIVSDVCIVNAANETA